VFDARIGIGEIDMRALITGAATGIGAATAERLRARGYEVVAMDIAEPSGVDSWVPVDMSDPVAIEAAVAQLSGSFDCLINNAGLPPRDGLEAKILAVNFTGMVQLTNAVLPMLKPGGSIVTTASRAGAFWRDNIVQIKALMALKAGDLGAFIASEGLDPVRAYNLSKEATIVWSMAQTERLLKSDLRINTVSPAAVSTGILDDFAAAFGERMALNVARVGRPGLAGEVADVIVYMASPDSGWLKGIDITVDGGMSAIGQSDAMEL
jgi:NAD(P)-dependent dehydrogenase (short-subunit alcohol dehydrogenase family)